MQQGENVAVASLHLLTLLKVTRIHCRILHCSVWDGETLLRTITECWILAAAATVVQQCTTDQPPAAEDGKTGGDKA
eukprot:CAMPEP_0172668318 /NCGR_PEP_ID=MMETSP1074-20121228/8989_1 /TAXON_ID=2916 /ORGANISM="Ceratium fusus, Strain PA161109" /LENGTH=76 /DNA_ID=CAMNT_0013484957 /DNA_START=152 /DNA_END=382 /DNA_ORIENTATION=+